MHAVDTFVQPLDLQRHHPHHLHAGQTNSSCPVLSTTDFLVPDAPCEFASSADTMAMTLDDSLTALAPCSTPSQDSSYTPNVASSLDATFHPDTSCPPQTAKNQTQYFTLSPASFYGSRQNRSPSRSVEQLSSDGGFMGEAHHQESSQLIASNINPPVLDGFTGLDFAENDAACAFPSYQAALNMAMLTSSSLNTYNAQSSALVNNVPREPRHQLLSPSATHTSSPVVGDDTAAFLPTMQYHGLLSSNPPSHVAQMPYTNPITQTQSPALTNSPCTVPFTIPQQPLMPHFTSPIVRVENCSREDSPLQSNDSRSIGKRSFDSRPSGTHLSPYPQFDSSDEEDRQREHVGRQPMVAKSRDRAEDGSWVTSGTSGHAGLCPEDRQALGNSCIPSIEDLADQRTKTHKQLEVHEWLRKSQVGSEGGHVETSNSLLKPSVRRRRAQSTNDIQRRHPPGNLGLGVHIDLDYIDERGIPGPGIYIDERSDFDDEEEDAEEEAEGEEDEDEGEEDEDFGESHSPPANVDYQTEQAESSYCHMPQDPALPREGAVRPWADTPLPSPSPSAHYQPPTSNAAMMRFRIRAQDIESASLAATVGSRRLSESDLGSLRAAPGVTRLVETDAKNKKDRQRRPSFLENILPKRTPNNLLKRKTNIPVEPCQEHGLDKSKEPVMEKPKRIGSWGRPKPPRTDSNLSNHSKETGPPSSMGFSTASGPWFRAPRNAIKRSRSKSDLGRSPGLAELMTQHGGPPMPMLAAPLAETKTSKPCIKPISTGGDDDDDDHDDIMEPVTMDLKVRTDPIIPSQDGFRTHVRQLNPRLADSIVERVAQEQMRRYKRLLEFRVKHLKAVRNQNCLSGKRCTGLGGEPQQLPPREGNKDADAPFIGFQITAPGTLEEDGEFGLENAVISAQFPSGVPLPPVKRLPAEFECPLCFKVKKFYKPSDWTKHVHEDIQPFTCTFPGCGDAKSFKRKADWVRHENERHRQLEKWTCHIDDCKHTCYRKDNFVQHLVREHKIAEPRQRSGRTGNKDSVASADPDDIWAIVERSHQETIKQPQDEPCRFCGNICTSWKKLTVHLAKHMEQISMPILTLVKQKVLDADSVISPVMEMADHRKLCTTSSQPPVDKNPSRYCPNSKYAAGVDLGSFHAQDGKPMLTSNVMHTYPPPHMSPYKTLQPAPIRGYSDYLNDGPQSFSNQVFPESREPSDPENGYANGIHLPNTEYHPDNLPIPGNQHGPISILPAQQPSAMYTDSPVDTTTAFPYFTEDLQNHMCGMRQEVTNSMGYPQSNRHSALPYTTTQPEYHY